MTEKCVFCDRESTPWQKVEGHLCFDCHCDSELMKFANSSVNFDEEQDEWAASKL